MEKINKKEKEELVLDFTNKYQKSLNFQRPLFSNFNEYYKLYRGLLDTGKQNYKGRAQLFVPLTYSTVETIIPRLVGNKPNIQTIPREPNDYDKAETVGKLMEYQWDMMNMKVKLKDFVKQGLLYGVGVLKLTWKFGGLHESDSPEAEVVDLFDLFVDPNATDFETADYVIHRTYRDLSELQNNANYDVPKELVADVSKDEYKTQRDAFLGLTRPSDGKDRRVEVLEVWANYDFGDGVVPALCVIANRKYLIRLEKNPYDHGKKPFILFKDTAVPHEFWAVGEVEPIVKLQYELNDIRNQRMDNVTLILNRMWKVQKGADVDEEDLVSQAGQVIHTGRMDGIEPLVTPDVTSSAYNEEGFIKDDAKTATGVNDFISGATGSGKNKSDIGNDTATGIMLLQEAGNARFKMKLDNLEDSLREFGRQLMALNQQFIDKEMVLRIVGEGGIKWVTISPDDIKGEFDVDVEAGSTQPVSKSVRRAEARELIATLMPLIPIAQQMGVNINLSYYLKNLLKSYDLQDIDEAFRAPGESAPVNNGELAREQGGAISGAFLGGNVGNRGNLPLQGMGGGNPNVGAQNMAFDAGA